ncbi:aminotransferase class IV [Acetivibrio cellulolyticus]|uniref:aminotransferase class IV n=1 Tax=Acetivibrio cellulolyticus TaxID=35830 RepID=UPI0001E2C307|nr:aminotransferase class IV [Acetivibrio cellulolyticus]
MIIDNTNDLISAYDYGFLYGFSIFETFCVMENGKVFLLEKHIERMLKSAEFFGIEHKMSKDELINTVILYIKENLISDTILRMTLSAGNSQKSLTPRITFSCRKNTYTEEKITAGCKLMLSDIRKSENSVILRHKTSNYLENFVLMNKAIVDGFDDILFMNSSANVTETAKSNIFFVKGNTIHTPDLKCGLLPGVIREWVIAEAGRQNIECREGFYSFNDFIDADEVFVTNSAMGIMRVKSIGAKCINSEICDYVTKKLALILRLHL